MKRRILIAVLALAWAACAGAMENRLMGKAGAAAGRGAMAAMPPAEAAAACMLGSLKAFLIDYLWVKSDLLYREGRFDELRPVNDFIAALQPRNPAVAEYQAWQAAWGLSLAESDPGRSWAWIEWSIGRIEKAIADFPRRPSLRVLLGRVYLEKCGGDRPDFEERLASLRGGGGVELAARQFEIAVATEGHSASADVFLAECYLRMIAQGGNPGAEAKLGKLLDHVRAEHPGVHGDLQALAGSLNLKE